MSDEFVSNAFRFAAFIEEQYKAAKIILLRNDDGSLELTKQDVEGGRYYPMVLQVQEDPSRPSRIRLVIRIEEHTVRLLRRVEVIQWVEDCQVWLEKFHLREFPLTGRAAFLSALDALSKTRLTSAEVAAYLNAWIIELLKEHERKQPLVESSPLPIEETWQVLKAHGYNTMAKIHAYQILTWMNLQEEAFQLVEFGLENIREGREFIFAIGQPIDRQRVLNCVKAWRKASE